MPEQVHMPWRMLQPTESPPTKEKAPGRNCSLWTRAHKGAGFLAGAATCGGPMLEQSVSEELYPMERTNWAWGWGEDGFSFEFASCSPTLLLIYKKLNWSSSIQVCFAHDSEPESEPPVLILTYEIFLLFFPHHTEGREQEHGLAGARQSAKVDPLHQFFPISNK